MSYSDSPRRQRWCGFWSLAGCTVLMGSMSFVGAGEKVVVENALIRLIDEVEVPAREAGALVEILGREGDSVTSGQLIARIDNQLQKLLSNRAEVELAIARRELENRAQLELAAKTVELEEQKGVEQELTSRIAHKKAENPLKVDAAQKQMDLAKNELDRGLAAQKEFKGSISASEIDGRRLTYEHADLNARQMRFEQEIEVLLAEAEDVSTRTQVLSVEQARLQVDDATAKQEVAALQVKLKENQLETAAEALERREIRSPIEGIVVRVERHMGEWIEPGEPCFRIVRLDRLRVEGFLSARYALKISPGAKVLVTVQIEGAQPVECEGTVTFISPEIDPVNHEVRIWVEIDNAQQKFRPGMHGSLTIDIPAP
ncbi:HlyD family secretion protein [Planctomicrobium sp. SH661]|uniref:HlyD family secretion protein n=1 Tax=Planctomicrobium sp. SH661 TaxID=3448124 RepID=UPI003F5C55A3